MVTASMLFVLSALLAPRSAGSHVGLIQAPTPLVPRLSKPALCTTQPAPAQRNLLARLLVSGWAFAEIPTVTLSTLKPMASTQFLTISMGGGASCGTQTLNVDAV